MSLVMSPLATVYTNLSNHRDVRRLLSVAAVGGREGREIHGNFYVIDTAGMIITPA